MHFIVLVAVRKWMVKIMSKELIDRNQIRYFWVEHEDGTEYDGITLQSIINKMPTVDAVEIVRCSECKHRRDPMRCSLWYGTLDDNEYFLEHGKDFYCAFGERRSE